MGFIISERAAVKSKWVSSMTIIKACYEYQLEDSYEYN